MLIVPAALTAALVGCLIIGSVGTADDKPAGGAGATAGGSEKQQWAQNQNQWVQHSGEELEKADSLDKLFLIGCAEQDIFELLHKDDEQLTRQVQRLIEQQNLIMPQGISPILQRELQLIRDRQGEQFDVAFVSAIKATHAKALSRLEDMSKVAKDAAVKDLAGQALATARQQSQEIQQTAVAVGLPGAGGEARPAGERIPAGGK
jgi:Domain of unknown function (DUF4142)